MKSINGNARKPNCFAADSFDYSRGQIEQCWMEAQKTVEKQTNNTSLLINKKLSRMNKIYDKMNKAKTVCTSYEN